MKTPSEFAHFTHAPAHADEAELRSIFRVFLLASVLMVTALVPFFLALQLGFVGDRHRRRCRRRLRPRCCRGPRRTIPRSRPTSSTATRSRCRRTFTATESALHFFACERRRVSRRRSTDRSGFPFRPPDSASASSTRSAPRSRSIFTSYTGGLHCCTQITVLELFEGNVAEDQSRPVGRRPAGEIPVRRGRRRHARFRAQGRPLRLRVCAVYGKSQAAAHLQHRGREARRGRARGALRRGVRGGHEAAPMPAA